MPTDNERIANAFLLKVDPLVHAPVTRTEPRVLSFQTIELISVSRLEIHHICAEACPLILNLSELILCHRRQIGEHPLHVNTHAVHLLNHVIAVVRQVGGVALPRIEYGKCPIQERKHGRRRAVQLVSERNQVLLH